MKRETKDKIIIGLSYAASVALVSSAVCYLAKDVMMAGGYIEKKPAYEEIVMGDIKGTSVADAGNGVKISDTGAGLTVITENEEKAGEDAPKPIDEEASEAKTEDNKNEPVSVTEDGAAAVSDAAVTVTASGTAIAEENGADKETGKETEDDKSTYFKDTLFIGDSRTDGLHINTGEKNAQFYACKGLAVNNILTEKFVKLKGSKDKVTLIEALNKNSFKKIYISLGVNELGWAYADKFIDQYKEVIEAIMEAAPDSEIVVQSILPITKKRSTGEKVYTNEKVTTYNELIKAMCEELSVTYGDVVPAVANTEGYLPEEGSVDGIHLKKSYYQKWLDYIKEEGI